ncbi:uncharacterized protein LOC108808435 [Raphanus sativus]|uniref:Uncharacterized protein LOC108808435 n=1 Tax=Raphanus sativus TaxID=3726 RepID=A0A6J0JKA5_RAPSA|nr:uncharacterized protein LOC108808435 [Raphanus sativus]
MTSQPLRTILHSPSQSGRLAKWAIELGEYDIEYKPRTSSKAQVLADFIIELVPSETNTDDKTQKWKLHVDGASSKQGSGVGIQLESPTGEMMEQSFRLGFNASNNEAEYESLSAGLRLAQSIGARKISAFSNSQLVTSQFHGEYEAKNERMEAYLAVLRGITQQFDEFELTRIPRGENTSADALVALASTSNLTIRRVIPVEGIDRPSIDIPLKGTLNNKDDLPLVAPIVTRSKSKGRTQEPDEDSFVAPRNRKFPGESSRRTRSSAARTTLDPPIPEEIPVHEVNNEPQKAFQDELENRPDWRTPLYNYIDTGELPPKRWEARKVKGRSSRYCIMEGKLYKRTFSEPYLLCASPKQASTILKKTHDGSCENHSGGRSLAIKIKKHGYFWPTMINDSEQFTLRCDRCQRHTPMLHQPTQKLSTIYSPYPFMKWSMDIVGPFVSSGPAQLRFLLVMTDFFTKWIEAEAYQNITGSMVTSFIWKNIVCRHGLPYEIVTDNGPQFI